MKSWDSQIRCFLKPQCSPGPSHRAPSWSVGHTAASPTASTGTVPPSWKISSFALTVERMPAGRRRSQCRWLISRPPYPDRTLGHRYLLCPLWPHCHLYQTFLPFHRYSELRRPVNHRGAERTRALAGNSGLMLTTHYSLLEITFNLSTFTWSFQFFTTWSK